MTQCVQAFVIVFTAVATSESLRTEAGEVCEVCGGRACGPVMTGVGVTGVQLGITVLARPLNLTVTLVVIFQISAGTVRTRISSTVVNVDLTIHTCKSWHTVTPVSAIQIMTHSLMLTRVRGTLIGFGLAAIALIASRTGTCVLVHSILTLASI